MAFARGLQAGIKVLGGAPGADAAGVLAAHSSYATVTLVSGLPGLMVRFG